MNVIIGMSRDTVSGSHKSRRTLQHPEEGCISPAHFPAAILQGVHKYCVWDSLRLPVLLSLSLSYTLTLTHKHKCRPFMGFCWTELCFVILIEHKCRLFIGFCWTDLRSSLFIQFVSFLVCFIHKRNSK